MSMVWPFRNAEGTPKTNQSRCKVPATHQTYCVPLLGQSEFLTSLLRRVCQQVPALAPLQQHPSELQRYFMHTLLRWHRALQSTCGPWSSSSSPTVLVFGPASVTILWISAIHGLAMLFPQSVHPLCYHSMFDGQLLQSRRLATQIYVDLGSR